MKQKKRVRKPKELRMDDMGYGYAGAVSLEERWARIYIYGKLHVSNCRRLHRWLGRYLEWVDSRGGK